MASVTKGHYDIDDETDLTEGEKVSSGFNLARWLMDNGWVDELSMTEVVLTRELNLWLKENITC